MMPETPSERFFHRLPKLVIVMIVTALALTACKSNYTYDANHRLTSVTHNNGGVDKYTYDASGNIIRVKRIPPPPDPSGG